MSLAAAADAAWASVGLPLAAAQVQAFLADVELVLRINPCLEFERLRAMPEGGLHMAGRNDSNDQVFATAIEIVPLAEGTGLVLRYASGIKRETRLAIAPAASGSVLTITEIYATPAADGREQGLREVDRSLVAWTAEIRRHLLRRARWGWLPGYRALLERFWYGMPPRQRRVVRLIVWTSVLEFLVFLGVVAVYVAS